MFHGYSYVECVLFDLAVCVGNPPNPANGSFFCGASSWSGTTCTATCQPGSSYANRPRAVCGSTGQWGTVQGICTLVPGCHVVIERNPDASDAAINLLDFRLYNNSGVQIPLEQLSIDMSSIYQMNSILYQASHCIDGNLTTMCHTALPRIDSSAGLRITYPCAQGLTRVEVVNRQSCCQDRILKFRMRAVIDGADLAPPYPFTTVASTYAWPLGELLFTTCATKRRFPELPSNA